MTTSTKSERYMAIVIAAGAVCVGVAAFAAEWQNANIYLLLLAAFTVGIGSRMTIQIPRFKSHVSVSDTLIFLTLMLYGGSFAIMLAAVEATVSSWKFCNRKVTVVFNAATMALSTGAVVLALDSLRIFFDKPNVYGHTDDLQTFIIALSLVALTQFLCNTILAAVHGSLKEQIPLWETWKSKYIWTFLSYLIGATGAGIMVQISQKWGFGIILASFPVIFFVYLTYRMYLKNVEISMQQAEQAEEYAKVLETQSNALRESEARFRSAFDYAPIGIGLVSPFGKWLKVNLALTEILGYSQDEFLATDFQSLIHPDYIGSTLTKVHELLSGKNANTQMEQRYIHKNGQTVWTLWSVSAASNTKSEQPNLIFQLQDITAKKSAEEKLQHEATHDALTGLPNRPVFMKCLGEALEKSQQLVGYKVTVLFIDLDRFKYVNDSLGHLIGDELLKEIGVRLRDCMRPSDLVARLGGDEFTILVEGKFDISEVARIAERIQQKFSLPFDLRGHEVYSSASIGILHASEKHLTSEDVMRDADTAMYQAKRAGKARHEVFDEKMHSVAKETLQLETDLRRAVERDCIEVVYQPIYSLEDDQIECFESLARWVHPELGEIKPSKFIALAEEIGLINRVCEQVLRKACQEIGSLQKRQSDEKKYSVSVNLSCRQFSQKSLVKNIENILEETKFSPHRLKLEITESVFFEHQDRAVVMLNQLREDGIEINIDDFGTGYSNLGYLMKLPISALKIDRSFVSMIDSEGKNDEIVRAIITLSRNLGLKVIAEGVETKSQVDALKRLKCEAAQGYHFAAPMTFDALKEFLNYDDSTVDMPPAGFDDVSTLLQIQ
jgi:diguanylate cyclase (GGDEF)-like protein/PAS domain S-box-containing protein